VPVIAIALALAFGCASSPGPGILLSDASVSRAAVESGALYGYSTQGILAIPLDGGTTQTLAPSRGGASLASGTADIFWIDLGAADPNVVSTGSTVRAVSKAGGAVRVVAEDPLRGDNLHVQGGPVFWDSQDGAIHSAAAAGSPVRNLVAVPDAECMLAGTDATQVYFFEHDIHTGSAFVGAIPLDGAAAPVSLATGGIVSQGTFEPGAVLWADFHGLSRVVERTGVITHETTDVGVWLPGINWIRADSAGGYTSSSLCTDGDDGDNRGCTSSLQDLQGRIIATASSSARGLALDANWVYWSVAGAGIFRVHR
jgi:hypothetical protein